MKMHKQDDYRFDVVFRMLNMKQPKKSNSNIRYSLGNNAVLGAQISGKVVKKMGTIKQKLHKNQSQLPVGILNESKQNASLANLMFARPHSSLVASDISGSLSKSRQKIDLNSFCKDKIKLKKVGSKRNTLGIADIQIKHKKLLGASNSQKKWNNRSVQQDPSILKFQMAENRKKYNLSCGDMIESKSKCKQNVVAKGKKKSLQTNISKIQPQKPKKSQKPEPEIKRFKPSQLKSKGSTAMIANGQQQKPKKKENKENKRKKRSQSKSKSRSKRHSKSNKMFIIPKGDEDDKSINQDPDYPINKYVEMKKGKKSLNIRVGVDYRYTGINIITASSGVLGDLSDSIERTADNKILASLLQPQASDSLNIQEIKYYQLHSPLKNQQNSFISRRHIHRNIKAQLSEQYPYLNSAQLSFLASVVLIQRKWREYRLSKFLSQRRQIITQYLVEDDEKSKDRSRDRSKERSKEKFKQQFIKKDKKGKDSKNENVQKTDGMSRTKLAQSEGFEQKQHENGDMHEYQTRKNSPKHDIIIDSGQSPIQQKQSPRQSYPSSRKPNTEKHNLALNYSHILSNQLFPELSYLEYRKNLLRRQYENTMKLIIEQKQIKTISDNEFELKKNDILQMYEHEITQLKKTKHDIKKGYLKYIDCIQKVKGLRDERLGGSVGKGIEVNGLSNKYGMRKVSSDSNFLATLYEKIFRFDKCISEWSGGSESIQMLTKKILIRKQFFKQDKKSQRRSLSDLRSAARSSFELIRSCRDAQNNTVIVFQHTDRLGNNLHSSDRNPQDESDHSQTVRQFKFSNEIFKSKQVEVKIEDAINKNKQAKNVEQQQLKTRNEVMQNQQKDQKQQKKCLQQLERQEELSQPFINSLTNSISLIQSAEATISRIEDQIILQLTRELEKDIHRINPVLVDIILINQPDNSQFDGVDFQEDLEDEEDFKSPAMKNLVKEFEDVHSPRQPMQKPRVVQNSQMEPGAVLEYSWGLANYIKAKNWINEITLNMNNNQTFQAQAYLKFLRDFEIPEDEYIPIITNQKFIEWQTFYNNQQEQNQENNSDFLRQSQTIFHRCIFQVFLSQLQKNRPYGERGRPFPWQSNYSALTLRQVSSSQMPVIFQQCIHKIEEYLIYKCGLIEQKIVILNQEQLERAHEENEDRIIEMLEQDLTESPHVWYEVEEHGLEIKLEVTEIVEELLFEQMIRLLLQFR